MNALNKRIFAAVLVATVVAPCWGQEIDRAMQEGLAVSLPFNDGTLKLRLGYVGPRTEIGPVVGYRDDLAPDTWDAWFLGIYALWYANPDGQIPIGGLFPDGWLDFLPATIPVKVYVGIEVDYEFEDHNVLGGPLIGARVKTGDRVEIGGEFVYEGLIAKWFPDTGTTGEDDWKFYLVPWFDGRKGIPPEEFGKAVAAVFNF